MWKFNQGSFDAACYKIDHIVECSLTQNDNLQALCHNCYAVKTRLFKINEYYKNNTIIDNQIDDTLEIKQQNNAKFNKLILLESKNKQLTEENKILKHKIKTLQPTTTKNSK